MDGHDDQKRDLVQRSYSKYPIEVDRWAIVVGISKYQAASWDLQYAHRDAEAFSTILRSPSGGGFDDRHIVQLIDAEATTRNITKALRGFLKKPKPEDVVILYFACHGTPDPDRPNIVYLVTHDTDPDDIAGTALPMREIDNALRENMMAERAVIFADTCHSGSIGGKVGRRSTDNDRVVAKYLQSVSEAKAGIALITAAQAGESSKEHARWGDGHGVFTHFLLEGMRGKADGVGGARQDGVVTIRELFEYVRANVLRETDDTQHPWLGPNEFDDRLAITITGGASAIESLRVGVETDRLARHLDDPRQFRAAAVQFGEALRLSRASGQVLVEAAAARGLAWLDAGDNHRAIESLRECIDADRDGLAPLARYHLGLALHELGDHEGAAQALGVFADTFPQHTLVPWSRALIGRIEALRDGQTRALIIGASFEGDSAAIATRNDVSSLYSLLVGKLGFHEANVVVVQGEAATRRGILDALDSLRNQSSDSDCIVVFYTGHSVNGCEADPDAYLIASDARIEDRGVTSGFVTVHALHTAMLALRGARKWLVLDTNGDQRLVDRVRASASYILWSAASPGSAAHTESGSLRGAFSGALVDVLQQERSRETQFVHERIERAIAVMGLNQKPILEGVVAGAVFTKDAPVLDGLSRRVSHMGSSARQLEAAFLTATSSSSPYPELFSSLGLGLLQHAAWGAAARALHTAREQGDDTLETRLGLAIAHAANHDFVAAEAALGGGPDQPENAHVAETRAGIQALRESPIRAVIIGVNRYRSLPELRGAVNDARSMRDALVEHGGVPSDHVHLLTDEAATRQGILNALEAIKDVPSDVSTLVYFAGYGSGEQLGEGLSIVPSDGRGDGAFDLTLDELRTVIRNDAAGPLVILDAGWTFGPRDTPAARAAQADKRSRDGLRELGIKRPRTNPPNHLGRYTIFNHTIRTSSKYPPVGMEAECTALDDDIATVHPSLTSAIVTQLRSRVLGDLTIGDIVRDAAGVVLLPSHCANDFPFAPRPTALLAHLRALQLTPVRNAIRVFHSYLTRAGSIEQGAYFRLGLAHFVVGEYEDAIRAFHKERELNTNTKLDELAYYLGRTNLEIGNLGAAMSELESATRLDPAFVPAHYYLGEAIRQFVQKQQLVRARDAFEVYLAGGAPHGRTDEVKRQLGVWRTELGKKISES